MSGGPGCRLYVTPANQVGDRFQNAGFGVAKAEAEIALDFSVVIVRDPADVGTKIVADAFGLHVGTELDDEVAGGAVEPDFR